MPQSRYYVVYQYVSASAEKLVVSGYCFVTTTHDMLDTQEGIETLTNDMKKENNAAFLVITFFHKLL